MPQVASPRQTQIHSISAAPENDRKTVTRPTMMRAMPIFVPIWLDLAFPGDLTGQFSAGALLGAGLICLARICDVSLGTIRTIYTLRGRKIVSSLIGLVESTIFITAISSVLAAGLAEPIKIIGYVTGYALGIYIGISLEGLIASGWTLIRVITRDSADELTERLREQGEAVTRVMGEGRDGPVPVLFVVVRRKRARRTLKMLRQISPKAFITVDSVAQAIGGTIPSPAALHTPLRMMVRK